MLSKKCENGRGLNVFLQEGETREEMVERIVMTATRKAFAAESRALPENISVAKYIFAGPLCEGEAIVKPFSIQGVYVPLFIKHTDSLTKILIAPLFGRCPSVIASMIKEIRPEPFNSVPSIPIGLCAESSH